MIGENGNLDKTITGEQKLMADWLEGMEGECDEERVTVMWSCDPRGESLQRSDILGLKKLNLRF